MVAAPHGPLLSCDACHTSRQLNHRELEANHEQDAQSDVWAARRRIILKVAYGGLVAWGFGRGVAGLIPVRDGDAARHDSHDDTLLSLFLGFSILGPVAVKGIDTLKASDNFEQYPVCLQCILRMSF
jgi:hypothetical protein